MASKEGLKLGLEVGKRAGFGQTNPSPKQPRRITNTDHVSGMVSGLQRRMSQKNSRLSAPRKMY